ncbi:MAG: hypothetical protein J6Y03_03885 [Alphaproteobacteria bacterium]|nr:hypothetical protein [Alphaproteobacteria bacterium]
MILFVIIGAFILIKLYNQVVLPPDVQSLLNKIEREQHSNSNSHTGGEDEFDLIENDIIDVK